MARRRKGRDISGWLLVDKPAGMTSTAVVNKVRWAFDAKKAGHAGTLDPDATGLLPVALGEATKTIAYLGDALKGYDFTVRWGIQTTTDDAAGEVIAASDARPSEADIEAALPAFTGDIRQVPPQFSAVKVDGARAYDLAREGETLELDARDLYVDELTLVSRPDADHAELRFVCGSGGYVRSIARDLGQTLGCLGHVTALRRTWVGPFDIEHAVTLDEVERLAKTPEIDALLAPTALALADLPELKATEAGVARLRNGNPGQVLPGPVEYGDLAWASHGGEPVAVGRFRAGELHPERVFNL
ncbi:tRNA pseudouridine(55) synthase TruB [Roseibacterium sp. SDUM158016]|uniref:tRNA pseudouridine(55) synthase TruB n=1 Tax=Roseicyclus sediminis TaxID=2980997 RepID=UPI0021CF7DC9|nr:tRNA pseudouridine(55) synthase TruB [Roseibacterium sp. SDUM158016]MCU4651537.1 tRNA pseudouridine(55) synthase TruB [Roseibacterium sp. SDUM158016]